MTPADAGVLADQRSVVMEERTIVRPQRERHRGACGQREVVVETPSCYAVRERRRMWSSRPSAWLAASCLADVPVAGGLALRGTGMIALSPQVIGITLCPVVALAFVLDGIKVPVFRTENRLKLLERL